MNCFAAVFDALRCGRSACADRRGPSRRRGRRTAARCVFTSGSIGAAANSGRSARSIGMSTSEKSVIVCALPSSSTWKSSFFRSRTRLPLLVGDDRVDLDVVDLTLKVGGCWAGGGGWRRCGAWPAVSAVPASSTSSADQSNACDSWSILAISIIVAGAVCARSHGSVASAAILDRMSASQATVPALDIGAVQAALRPTASTAGCSTTFAA